MCRRGTFLAIAITLLAPRPALAGETEGEGARGPLSELARVARSLEFESGEATWRIGGRLAGDLVERGSRNIDDDGGSLDGARIDVHGEMGAFRWFAAADLVGADTPRHLYEAWVAVDDVGPALTLKAGQMRVPITSEFAVWEEDSETIGYGFATHLSGRTDWGVRLEGRPILCGPWAQLTVTAGSGFGLEGHRRSARRYALRAGHHLFRGLVEDPGWLRDLADGFFVGAAYARESDFDDPVIVTSPVGVRVFGTPDLNGDDGAWQAAEFGWVFGALRLGLDRVQGEANDVPTIRGDHDFDQLTGTTAYASWNLSGEGHDWVDGRWVTTERDERERPEWLPEGRWDFSVRYSNSDIDRELILRGITAFGTSEQEVRTTTLALNWRPSEHVRLTLAWVNQIGDDGVPGLAGERRDRTLLLRLDVHF